MRKIKNELEELVYEEYGEELNAKDREIESKEKTIISQAQKIKSKKLKSSILINPTTNAVN